jgi:ABC-2 type transport system ATP-binding protein
VRHEFLEAVIANVQSEGGTVFFSTHLLHEMERIADRVAILHDGRLLLEAPLDAVKEGCKKVRAVYPDSPPASFPLEGLLHAERNAHQAVLTVARYDPGMPTRLREAGAASVEVLDLSLEEIFVALTRGGHHA